MELLSGILLTGVILCILYILIKETLGERLSGFLASGSERSGSVEESLIGALGRVVDPGEEDGGNMKVRIGIERWSAALAGADEGRLPVGTEIKVTAVHGRLLEVEESDNEQAP